MIKGLYKFAEEWSKNGAILLYSDPHFDDEDCKYMDENWPEPHEQAEILKRAATRNDTLVILGDIGDPEYLADIKARKVLIAGNHDVGLSKYAPYFDEMYGGPLFISEKILLSHEPIILPFAYNIHGHDHSQWTGNGAYHYNVAANVIGYKPISLKDIIKSGAVGKIPDIHRITIDNAIFKRPQVSVLGDDYAF